MDPREPDYVSGPTEAEERDAEEQASLDDFGCWWEPRDQRRCAKCNGTGLYENGVSEPAKNAYCPTCGGLGVSAAIAKEEGQ